MIDVSNQKDEMQLRENMQATLLGKCILPIVSFDSLDRNMDNMVQLDEKKGFVHTTGTFTENDYLFVVGMVRKHNGLRCIPFGSEECTIHCDQYTSYGGLITPSCNPNCKHVAIQHPKNKQIVAVAVMPVDSSINKQSKLSVANSYSHAVFCDCTELAKCKMVIPPCTVATSKYDSLHSWFASITTIKFDNALQLFGKQGDNIIHKYSALLESLYLLNWYV